MTTSIPVLMSWLQDFGYPALWFIIFCAAIGLPLPINLFLLGVGAYAATGDFNLIQLIAIASSAAICGDLCGYLLGKYIGVWLLKALTKQKRGGLLTVERLERSRAYFHKRGAWAIFLSRSLFSVLGSPINLLAGIERYPLQRFLFYDACGEILGSIIPLALGFAFGASWEAIGTMLGMISLFTLALCTTIYLFYLLLKQLRRGLEIRYIRAQQHAAMLVAAAEKGEETDGLSL